jgi:Fe2+ or Zn2+ uptake regulation protein
MIITLRCHTVLKALAHHQAGATAEMLLADLGAESTDQRSAKAGILRTLMAMEEKGLARWEAGQPTGRFTITSAGQAQIAQPYCMPHHQQKSRARAGAS